MRGKAYSPAETALRALITQKGSASSSASTLAVRSRHVLGLMRKYDIPVPSPPGMQWLEQQHASLIKKVEKDMPNQNSRLSILSTLNQVAKWFDLPKTQAALAPLLTELSQKQKKSQLYQNTSARQNRNWCTFADVKKHAAQYISALEEMTASTRHIRVIQLALAAALNTMEPPMRSVYGDCVIGRSRPTPGQLGQGMPNYLYVPPSSSHAPCVIYISTDKVSNTKFKKNNLGQDNWELAGATSKLVKKSLDLWQRPLVMFAEEHSGNTVAYQTLIKQALSPPGKSVGAQMIRTLYVTHWFDSFKTKQPTLLQRAALARKMRHSVGTQLAIYDKPKKDA